MSLEEPAVAGHHDVGQPAHDGGSHSSGTVEGTAAPTPSFTHIVTDPGKEAERDLTFY